MDPNPVSTFGNLLLGCIRDNYGKRERGVILEGVVLLVLGASCSLATAYALSVAGLLV